MSGFGAIRAAPHSANSGSAHDGDAEGPQYLCFSPTHLSGPWGDSLSPALARSSPRFPLLRLNYSVAYRIGKSAFQPAGLVYRAGQRNTDFFYILHNTTLLPESAFKSHSELQAGTKQRCCCSIKHIVSCGAAQVLVMVSKERQHALTKRIYERLQQPTRTLWTRINHICSGFYCKNTFGHDTVLDSIYCDFCRCSTCATMQTGKFFLALYNVIQEHVYFSAETSRKVWLCRTAQRFAGAVRAVRIPDAQQNALIRTGLCMLIATMNVPAHCIRAGEWPHCLRPSILHTQPLQMGALVLRNNKNKISAETH